jgi:hypothetical protein
MLVISQLQPDDGDNGEDALFFTYPPPPSLRNFRIFQFRNSWSIYQLVT